MSLGQNTYFGKMFSDCFVPTVEEISQQSFASWPTSGIAVAGELWMASISEYPSAAAGFLACLLEEILEPNVATKYFLSPKACAGILRRAEKRGKKLPQQLEAALAQVASASQDEEEKMTKTLLLYDQDPYNSFLVELEAEGENVGGAVTSNE